MSIRVCFRGTWDNLRWDAGWMGGSTGRCLCIPCFHCRCSAARRDLGTPSLVTGTGGEAPLHPPPRSWLPPSPCVSLCPPHAAESQVWAVQRPDSFWHPSLDSVCSCCIFLFAGLFGHALVHSRHSGSNVSLFPIRKGARIWGGREGGLSSSF